MFLTRFKSKINFLPFFVITLLTGCGESKEKSEADQNSKNTEVTMEENIDQAEVNALSQKEKEEGWEVLFDGESTESWRGYNKDSFPSQGWIIEDGALKVQGSGAGEAGNGGDIIYDEEF